MGKPLLAIDIDGVVSVFGFEQRPEGASHTFLLVDGMPHCISLLAGNRLRRLEASFELVWASGWEDKANFYLPQLLGLPDLPHVSFDDAARDGVAHWKLGALGEYARGRAMAWIDDNLDRSCHDWAAARCEPTLLVPTEPELGLEEVHVDALEAWAASLD
ncbi:MAG: hypothetical protein R2725_01245 [Solirubrobacterales bacterium]